MNKKIGSWMKQTRNGGSLTSDNWSDTLFTNLAETEMRDQDRDLHIDSSSGTNVMEDDKEESGGKS